MLKLTEAQYAQFQSGRGQKLSKAAFKLGSASKNPVKVSPHAQALAQLAKKPESANGKQEHFLQVRIFDYFERKHPEIYEFMCAYPAGGMRSKKVAAEMRAEGQVSGYPDIVLDIPAGVYHGARFELKTDVGTLQATQKATLKKLSERGYYCTARKGFDDMVTAILAYARLEPSEELEHSQLDEKWLNYQCDK